jgi:hypothetical protein
MYTLYALLLSSSLLFGNINPIDQLQIRFNHEEFDVRSQELTVSIQLKSQNSSLVLAGQNYRIYYPSDIIHFVPAQSKSNLNSTKFASLTLTESIEQVDASKNGELEFDKNLGFANITIDLNDLIKGGEQINPNNEWKKIATLRFKVLDMTKPIRIMWAREGVSDSYATAFVNVAKWNSPMNTTAVQISEYHDYEFSIKENILSSNDMSFTVSPNPTADFLDIKFSGFFVLDKEIVIHDLSGKMIKTVNVPAGSAKLKIDVSSLLAADYIINLVDQSNKILQTQQLTVVH